MAPHIRASEKRTSLGRLLLSLMLIIFGIFVFIVLLTAGIDLRCSADIDFWTPIYPGAEHVRTDQRGCVRRRAWGITERVCCTSDEPVLVRTWYRDYRRGIPEDMATRDSDVAARGLADTSYRIADDPDSDGTLIYFYSECAYY